MGNVCGMYAECMRNVWYKRRSENNGRGKNWKKIGNKIIKIEQIEINYINGISWTFKPELELCINVY
jgi:hypothetical protein